MSRKGLALTVVMVSKQAAKVTSAEGMTATDTGALMAGFAVLLVWNAVELLSAP